MGKKCDRSDFDRGMIVGVRWGGLSIPETADHLAFSYTNRVYREWCEKQKHPVSGSSVDKKALLMRVGREKCIDWFKLTERQFAVFLQFIGSIFQY